MAKEKSTPTQRSGKIYQFFNQNKFILLSMGIAFLITQLVYFCFDLVPYGQMTILRMDLYHQYGPLFAELYDRITSGESLIYSWNSGLGSSFLGNFFNYLSSPLSFLILLFGHKNITEAISLMIALKATLSAGFFTYYLKKSLNKDNFLTTAFGIMYAFCGFFVAYYWNLMWLDAMVLFPLVILGIEYIIQKGKPTLYCVTLSLTMLSNYYMAFMVCIFAILYFLTYYFAHYSITQRFTPQRNKNESIFQKLSQSVFFNAGIKFAFYSVVAALLAAFALLPLMTILSGSSATSSGAPTVYKKYFTVFDFLANHLASVEPTIRSSGNDVIPNVYCGILTVMLVPLFLFSKKITTREKVSYVGLLGVLYFSFNINFLNFFWHGFHFPNDLPYRFSFMYSFVLLVIAFKALSHLKEFTNRQILTAGLGVVFFLILVEKITSKNVSDISLGLSLAFTIGYIFILTLLNNKKFQTTSVAVLLLCTVTSEIALCNTNNYSMNQSKANYTADYQEFNNLKKELDAYDNGFYRMELTSLRTRMDPSWYDYNGISVFSSMAYEKVANLQKDIGIYGNYINSYTYNPQTPVYNAMFGLKYLIDNCDYNLSKNMYSPILDSGKFTAYQNQYALPIAYAVNANVADWSSSETGNPFEAQAQWFDYATEIENVFEKLVPNKNIEYDNLVPFDQEDIESGKLKYQKLAPGENASFTFEFDIPKDENIYVYIKSSATESASVTTLKGTKSFSTNEGHIVDSGTAQAGETVYLDVPIKSGSKATDDITLYVYTINMGKFKSGYDTLNDSGKLEIKTFNDTCITGSLTVKENEIIYTSIPYDDNWKVFVDGKRIAQDNILKISDGLLGFLVDAGTHDIALQYESKGLEIGCIITGITLILCTVIIIFKRRRVLYWKKERLSKWENAILNSPVKENDRRIDEYILKLENEESKVINEDIENRNENSDSDHEDE